MNPTHFTKIAILALLTSGCRQGPNPPAAARPVTFGLVSDNYFSQNPADFLSLEIYGSAELPLLPDDHRETPDPPASSLLFNLAVIPSEHYVGTFVLPARAYYLLVFTDSLTYRNTRLIVRQDDPTVDANRPLRLLRVRRKTTGLFDEQGEENFPFEIKLEAVSEDFAVF